MNDDRGSVPKKQTLLSIIGLILALPFPIFIIILWSTLDGIRGSGQSFSENTVNIVLLYLFQFFLVPVLTLTSVIIAFIVTLKPQQHAKKIGYISLGVTAIGLVILGLFLNNSP